VAHRLTRHLVLVGMTASGKTSVANEIARRLNVARLDTDDIVQIIDGRSVRDIFAEDGESKFRQIESQALMSALSRPEPSVIAVAAGAVTVESNREQLGEEGHRPLLDNDAADTLQAMATTRTPLYEAVATHAVDTQGHDVARVAELVIELVNESMKG